MCWGVVLTPFLWRRRDQRGSGESDKLLIVLRGRFLVLGGTGCPRYDRFIRDLWWFADNVIWTVFIGKDIRKCVSAKLGIGPLICLCINKIVAWQVIIVRS